jgi:hypothetical protein
MTTLPSNGVTVSEYYKQDVYDTHVLTDMYPAGSISSVRRDGRAQEGW